MSESNENTPDSPPETPSKGRVGLSSDDLLAIRDGIAPYKHERQRIITFLDSWKSQDDFDCEFRRTALGAFRKEGLPGNGLMLGGIEGYGTLSWWIDLLQHMVVIGDVKQDKGEAGQLYLANELSSPLCNPA